MEGGVVFINFLRYFFWGLCASAFLLPNLTGSASSAEFALVKHEECNARLEGKILRGDLKRIAPLLGNEFQTDNDEGSEAAISSRICLNSPGGNLEEAALIGQHLYKNGIGTYVDEGDKCLSACAFIFMMGTATGGESVTIDRAMHALAVIGFHRPSIAIPELPSYTSTTVQNSFDAAINSVFRLISLGLTPTPNGDDQMIKPDLLKEALAHSGQDFFYIDTVDKIGRWNIDLKNYKRLIEIGQIEAWNACHNVLAWKSNLNASHQVFNESNHSDRVVRLSHSNNKIAFQIEAIRMENVPSHGDWFAASCIIGEQNGFVSGCGSSNQNDSKFGSLDCGNENTKPQNVMSDYFVQFATYAPTTKLSHIAARGGSSKVINSILSGTCSVHNADTLIDKEPCTKKINIDDITVISYVWPSGGKTIVTMSTTNSYALNGNATKLKARAGYNECYDNPKSGNTFCYVKNKP